MTTTTCQKCGRPVRGDEAHGLCPACLFQQGLAVETAEQEEVRCKGCHEPLTVEARFCPRCGTPVPEVPEAPEDPLRHALEVKLGGQYRVLRLLGRGGMGAVYLARDLTLEREVAIKVVKPASDARGMYDRFRREARTAAKLSHPNIVPLHAFGEVEGMPYFVMGYVRGESLADRLRREGRIPEDEARRVLAEIADALDHAHRLGVVHRDVKPDNVLLEDASGRALLTDFGIAKTMNRSESLTQAGGVVGTPHFMSPEQASGRSDIDGRSDIYSLGVMGYVMLAGRLPFDGSSAAGILARHLTEAPPPLRTLAPSVSDATLQAIDRCMAKDPARRWQDARALKTTLGAIEESALPDALQAVEGHGMAFLAIAITMLLLMWLVVIRLQHAPIAVLGIIAVAILSCYGAIVGGLRLEGFPLALAQRVIWTEPSWWPLWYPRALRRKGNVWDRLPRSVRRLRCFIPLIFICFAVTAVDPTENFSKKLALFIVVLATGIAIEFAVMRQLKRMGFPSGNDVYRIAYSAPPSRTTFWSQPRIAAVLAPAADRQPPRSTDSPHDQLQSILRMADELSGPLRPLGTEAAEAGRRLIASIEESDRRIAELARSVEPGEEQRLVEKIDALADVEESASLRALLEKQLELTRGLSARIEEARQTRSRHIEVLKTLALHLASLRARVAGKTADLHSLSDNVRALCENISRQGTSVRAEDLPTVEQRG